MKKRNAVSLGPGASSLILIFVVLALTVLGMLGLMNSRNDLTLSERSARVAEAAAELNVKTEEKRAKIDALLVLAAGEAENDDAYLSAVSAALPETMNVYDREISWIALDSWEGTDGLRQMDCALEILPLNGGQRTQWLRHDLSAVTDNEVLALNSRAESKRLALESILAQAAESAADDAAYLAAIKNLLPEDVTMDDRIVSFVETNAGTETEYLRALHAAVAIQPLSSETSCAWASRSVADVTDDTALAIIEQADDTLEKLTQVFTDTLQRAMDADWQNIEELDGLFLSFVQETLPKDASCSGREISWVEASGDLRLSCAVELQPLGSSSLTVWTGHNLWQAAGK